jgi:hypothetical protein
MPKHPDPADDHAEAERLLADAGYPGDSLADRVRAVLAEVARHRLNSTRFNEERPSPSAP